MNELRLALRMILRAPGFSMAAVLLLAAGIGVNLTMFSGINGGLLKPQPGIADPSRLVAVGRVQSDSVSYPEFRAVGDQNHVFEGVAAFSNSDFAVTVGDLVASVRGAEVSANYFRVLGVSPLIGRFFTDDEETPGRAAVAVVSHRFWTRDLKSDPGALGREIRINGGIFKIVGVAQEGFLGTVGLEARDVWAPVAATPRFYPNSLMLENPRIVWLQVLARLRPSVGLADARGALLPIRTQFAAYGDRAGQLEAAAYHHIGNPSAVRQAHEMAALLQCSALLVLLVACANVANLLLAKSLARRREVAIRLALGASRADIARLNIVEGLLLASVAAPVGFVLHLWGRGMFLLLLPGEAARILDSSVDWRVGAFASVCALLAGIASALPPALQASRFQLHDRSQVSAGSRLASGLVVAQVALCMLMLAAGGLLLSSSRELASLDLRINARGLLLMTVSPHLNAYKPADGRRFYESALERARALPGVVDATMASNPPLSGSSFALGRLYGGQFAEDGLFADTNVVEPRYFDVLGIPVLAGRAFDDSDREGSQRVAIVNEALARRMWPGESPVGRSFRTGSRGKGSEWTVVGVARDSHYANAREQSPPHYYLSQSQYYSGRATMLVRGGADPIALAGPLRGLVAALDPYLPVTRISTMEEHVRESSWENNAMSVLVVGIAAVTLVLAMAGLYASLSHRVAGRTREIGVRIALGAERARILRATLGDGMRLVAVGLTIGVGLALAVTRTLKSFLYKVTPNDPAAFALAAVVLGAAAVAACILPARRATCVDPVVALRHD